MSINQLYFTWMQRIKELHPRERKTRIRNMALLLSGIAESRSVHLSKIANKIPLPALNSSIVRRLGRFLDNPIVRVRHWYEPVARRLITQIEQHHHEFRLIVDGSKIGFNHQLLIISIGWRRRALPLAWTWVKGVRGHSSVRVQLALLVYVRRLLPAGYPVLLVGDNEFGPIKVLQQLDAWQWHYVLRQQKSHRVKLPSDSLWHAFGDLISRPGQRLWFPAAKLTRQWAYDVNLVAWWQPGEKDPWLLATNLPSLNTALKSYQRRMWIEAMFADFKRQGFDLESTHLRHFQRLSRLTLAVVLLYVWLVSYGSYIIKIGQRHLVDRRDRRDLSLFRIGYDMIQRRLTRALSISITFSLHFT